jgi:predicted HicB family RNase H-like nuclease
LSTGIDLEKYIFYNRLEVINVTMKPGTKTVTLRISQELHEAIIKEAAIEERSVNNFIAYAMKVYIESKQNGAKN